MTLASASVGTPPKNVAMRKKAAGRRCPNPRDRVAFTRQEASLKTVETKIVKMLSDVARPKVRALFHRFGLEISRRDSNRFLRLIAKFEIDLIVDVGANTGQFATWVRGLGYSGRIVSFEPLAGAYAELQRRANHDSRWETYNVALGDFDGDAIINRSVESQLSSLSDLTERTLQMWSDAKVVGRESIAVRRLDSVFNDIRRDAAIILLKIDTQGFEKRVLDGAMKSIPSIAGARLELSYDPLYEGELNFDAMVAHMSALGYTLVMLDPIVYRPENPPRLLQADGTFFRFQS